MTSLLLVISAGNQGAEVPITDFPEVFTSPASRSKLTKRFSSDKHADLHRLLDNMILAGASNFFGDAAKFSQRVYEDGSSAENNIIYAPGDMVHVPRFPVDENNLFKQASGASCC